MTSARISGHDCVFQSNSAFDASDTVPGTVATNGAVDDEHGTESIDRAYPKHPDITSESAVYDREVTPELSTPPPLENVTLPLIRLLWIVTVPPLLNRPPPGNRNEEFRKPPRTVSPLSVRVPVPAT
jgi:hypothetical protein